MRAELKYSVPKWLVHSMVLSMAMLAFWGWVSIRWDYSIYDVEQLVPVSCTFQSFYVKRGYRTNALYIIDSTQHSYRLIMDDPSGIRGKFKEGDKLQLLITPTRMHGLYTPTVAYLKMNGEVYFDFVAYRKASATAHKQYLVLTVVVFLDLMITSGLAAYFVVKRYVKKRKKRKIQLQKKRVLNERNLLHPTSQREKNKSDLR